MIDKPPNYFKGANKYDMIFFEVQNGVLLNKSRWTKKKKQKEPKKPLWDLFGLTFHHYAGRNSLTGCWQDDSITSLYSWESEPGPKPLFATSQHPGW